MADLCHTGTPLDDTEPRRLADPLPDGFSFGRYIVRHRLDSVAGGVVYSAYDPELEREVALKVLQVGRDEGAADRLLKEGQALARIRHPNVVTVYDAGTVGDHLFLAMELIDGLTLGQWRLRQTRSTRELLSVFRAAGEGLCAAQRAGLVHRDFQPASVVIGHDGRVCVTDFGLWSAAGAGRVIGPPNDLAAVDAGADQLAFCAALFESLYGTPPLTRSSADAREVTRRLRGGAPARVRRALARGLALDGEPRFADLQELLRALAPRRQRRLLGLAMALLIPALLAATAIALPRLRAHAQIERCQRADGRGAALWSLSRRQALARALDHTGSPSPSPSPWTAAQETLDRWIRSWTGLHAETCQLAGRADAESQSRFDLRMECLDRRWQDANATLSLLTTRPQSAQHAVQAIASLPPVEPCADAAALARPLRPPAAPAQLRPIDGALARARADFAVENCAEALTEATRAADTARTLGALVLESEARSLIGLSHMCLGDRDKARASFLETAVLAEQSQNDQGAVTAYLHLVSTDTDLGRYPQAEHWLQLARDSIAAHGGTIKLRAELEYDECYVPLIRGHLAAAEPHCRRSRALFAQLPTRTLNEADAAQQLGALFGRQGKFAEADEAYRDAQRLFRQLNGPDSTNELRVLEMLADDEAEQDHLATALALQKRVVEHGSKAFPDQLAIDLAFYGNLLVETGRAGASLDPYRRALAASETIESEHDFETGIARAGLGSAYLALGKPQLALGYLETARRMLRVDGNEDVIAQLDMDLARALWRATPWRHRAVVLARQSRDFLRAHPLGALRARHLREVDAWLEQHDHVL